MTTLIYIFIHFRIHHAWLVNWWCHSIYYVCFSHSYRMRTEIFNFANRNNWFCWAQLPIFVENWPILCGKYAVSAKSGNHVAESLQPLSFSEEETRRNQRNFHAILQVAHASYVDFIAPVFYRWNAKRLKPMLFASAICCQSDYSSCQNQTPLTSLISDVARMGPIRGRFL